MVKMDVHAVIVISDDDNDDDSPTDVIPNVSTSASSNSSSVTGMELKKSSKKASMGNRTWCNIRQEKQCLKSTETGPITIDDWDDLPDLEMNEVECIYVKVYQDVCDDNSDCYIIDDDEIPEKKPRRKSEDVDTGRGKARTEESSSVSKSSDQCNDPHSQELSDSGKEKRKNFLSVQGRAKLADIFRKTHKTLKQSKSLEEQRKVDKASVGEPVKPKEWSFVMDRHFSDILGGDSPSKASSGSGNISVGSPTLCKPVAIRSSASLDAPSVIKTMQRDILSPPILLPSGPFKPINPSLYTDLPPVLELQTSRPSLSNKTDTARNNESIGSKSPPIKRPKLDKSYSAESCYEKTVKNNFRIVSMKLGKSLSNERDPVVSKRRQIKRIIDTETTKLDIKPSDVRTYFKAVKPMQFSSGSDSEIPMKTLKDWQNLKPLTVEFPRRDGFVDSLCSKLSQVHIDTVGVCFGEEGEECLRNALNFVHDFSVKYEPPKDLVRDVLYKGLLENKQVDIMYNAYRTLRLIQQKYPRVIEISWDMLQGVMENVNLGLGFVQQEPAVLLRTSLFLQLMVRCYGYELHHYAVISPKGLRQGLAYKNLTSECTSRSSGSLAQLSNWIVCCLTWGEFEEAEDMHYERNPDNRAQDVGVLRQEVKKILPLLQQLLDIAIELSLSSSDCARTCASELIKSFVYLGLSYKKLLLQTMQSSLLRFKLVSVMLENYCDCDMISSYEFPSSIRDVTEHFFWAHPPCLMNTPPTTPQSEDDDGDPNAALAGRFVPKVSPVSVEELAMLHFYALQSYLQCSKSKSYVPLRTRVNFKTAEKEFGRLSYENIKELERLPQRIEELRGHYLQLVPDLTQGTEKYLMLMLCLRDVAVKH